jgi:hypothetical protein
MLNADAARQGAHHVSTSSCCVALFAARFAFLALLPSLVSCLLAPPSGNPCNLTLLADIQKINEKSGRFSCPTLSAYLTQGICSFICARLLRKLFNLSSNTGLSVRHDCQLAPKTRLPIGTVSRKNYFSGLTFTSECARCSRAFCRLTLGRRM